MTDEFIFSPAVMITIGIIVALIVLAILFFFLKDVLTATFSKTVTTKATLSSKYEQDYVTQKVYAGGGAIGSSVAEGVAEKGKEYFFNFLLDNGKNLTFLVPQNIYSTAVEEKSGTLTYKGKRFISYDGPTVGTKISTDSNPNDFVGLNRTL